MKLFLSSFFIYIYFICSPALGDIFFNKYTIYTSGIKIGALNWEVKIKNNSYSNNISLKSEGFLSALYTFEGNYFSSGKINNKTLAPNNYEHFWQTKKIEVVKHKSWYHTIRSMETVSLWCGSKSSVAYF